MKSIAYIAFAIVYYMACVLPVNKNRFFCVMTHDSSEDSGVGVVIKEIKTRNPSAVFTYVTKEDRKITSLVKLIFVKSVMLATSRVVLMDNEFLPLAYVKRRKNVLIVQLWHGTGTIKKFGHDANEGSMLKRVTRADNKITHLIVNSDYTKELYKGAFGVTDEVVYVTGIPRTDTFFSEKVRETSVSSFYNEYPELKGRKLILYAPTFRDNEVKNPRCMLDFDKWVKKMDEDVVLLIRLHPHVAVFYKEDTISCYNGKVVNVSSYNDVNTLLFVSDALITDYSSIIFEYVVLDRPMYFYAYDFDTFADSGRGFYEEYTEYVPGKVVYTTEELIAAIQDEDKYKDVRNEFASHAYKYMDGCSTKRVVDLLDI